MQLRVKNVNQKNLKPQTTDKIKNGELAPCYLYANATEKKHTCNTHETEILNPVVATHMKLRF
jgi:hypothetical protein